MNRILTIFLLCALPCLPSWAYYSAARKQPRHGHGFYLGAGIGASYSKTNTNNYISSGAGWPNDHYSPDPMTTSANIFAAFGYTWGKKGRIWLPYYGLGLRYEYVPSTTVKGHINQYSLPNFNNYNYNYDVKLSNLFATAKVDIVKWEEVMPYLTAGAGGTIYSTSDYTETATANVTPRVSPGFKNNTATNFSYFLGVGLDYPVQRELWLNLEYNYASYGTIKTGKGANTSMLTDTNYSNVSLNNKITANTVFLGGTYYF
ncbi:MAG TPA: acyloxyacyl hydrolase [Gammaproteobacteria bacterium]|jgi:opacity protein-like surface antigen|nr:acyloxyacyl hydrolase [Gammaproteobacteria bacterium]